MPGFHGYPSTYLINTAPEFQLYTSMLALAMLVPLHPVRMSSQKEPHKKEKGQDFSSPDFGTEGYV